MSGSILIHSGKKKDRDLKITEILDTFNNEYSKRQHPDVLLITKEAGKGSIGIGEIRKAINFLITKPYNSTHKVIIIEYAHLLTPQAQNALLKTLEEPPSYGLIILESKTEDALLPTVISRCKKIKTSLDIKFLESELKNDSYRNIIKAPIGDKLEFAEKYSKENIETIIDFLEEGILFERSLLLNGGSTKHAYNIEFINEIKNDIENTNVNTRFALEVLFLNLEG